MKLSQIFKEALLEAKKKKPSDMIKKEGAEGMDHEVSMAKNSLESIIKSAIELAKKMGNDERNIPGWIQDHISKAENYIDQAAQGFHELGGHEEEEEDEEDNDMIQPVNEYDISDKIASNVHKKLNVGLPSKPSKTIPRISLELAKKYTPITPTDMPLDKYLASKGLVIVPKEDVEGINEKKLTKAERAKKEDIIKAMAMKGGGKENMGPKQYAIATAQAKRSAE